eukprot:scaffold114729_cov67-Phaeocystis_antarctica.AAC.1
MTARYRAIDRQGVLKPVGKARAARRIDFGNVGDRVVVHPGEELLHLEVNHVIAKRVGHGPGQVLEPEHDETDDAVHGSRHRPRVHEREEVTDEEERNKGHQVEQVEISPWHGLLEQVDNHRALCAQLQSGLRVIRERVRLQDCLHLRQRPVDRQDRLEPSVRDHPLDLLGSEQIAPLDDVLLIVRQGCTLKRVVLDMCGGVYVAETVPLHVGVVAR